MALGALGPGALDPDNLISTFGLIGILVVVFAESGLLIGFFLPGDSLLFTAGLLVAEGSYVKLPLWLVCSLIVVAAILGDQVGYLFGRKVGPALFRRPDSRLFKHENVEKAHQFFEKYGPRSIVLARFVPIVRTFTPIVAGVAKMPYPDVGFVQRDRWRVVGCRSGGARVPSWPDQFRQDQHRVHPGGRGRRVLRTYCD
jgi:membrane-associated protein